LMFEFHQSRATTLILVTHDSQLAKRCARQLILQSGRLVSQSLI
jgi:putative ABC transport system ATP-binding protein